MEEEKVKEVDCLELKWEVESLEEELWVWNISSNDEIFFQNSFGIFFTFWINFRKILKKKTPFLKKNGKIMKRNKNSNRFLYLQWNLHSAKSNKDNGKFIFIPPFVFPSIKVTAFETRGIAYFLLQSCLFHEKQWFLAILDQILHLWWKEFRENSFIKNAEYDQKC